MARLRADDGSKELSIDFGVANEKQKQFFAAQTMFVGYGGAKGGGKTWAVRACAVATALLNDGIQILIMRAHYPELESNHIRPLLRLVPQEIASYNGSSHLMTFQNGSTIKFGHWVGEQSEQEYQGQEYDRIFMDEATQFSERAFQYMGGCLRGATPFAKRMYITCNPGGVGHRWVKRLFIDRNYKLNCENPEENENPEDYTFIFATVEDNEALLKSSPNYLRNLANMPEDLRRAFRYGDWNAVGGNYFKEFTQGLHTVKPFPIPSHWNRYRSFDYGLDMFACIWWAIDEDGRCWAYREYERKGLIIQEAAKAAQEHTLPGERITMTYAPPDMWNRQKDSGKTMAELFLQYGLPITKSDNNRVQGHMIMKQLLAPIPLKDPYVKSLFKEPPEVLPAMMFFDDIQKVTSDIADIQSDEDNPNDCAKTPHEITHTVDACRYLAINRLLESEAEKLREEAEDDDRDMSYEEFMTGGEAGEDYINY